MPTRFDNRINRNPPDPHPPTVRKISADSVPFGSDISRNGRWLWAAFDDGGELVAVAATSADVRRKFCLLQRAKRTGGPKDEFQRT